MQISIKYIVTIFIAFIAFGTVSNAQIAGLGGSFNHTSNGINLFYSKESKNQKWEYDAGIRVMINTFSLNENKQHHYYYQTGYANRFYEYLSLNFRINRKLVSYRFIGLYAMSNLHLAYTSILMRSNTYDSATGAVNGYTTYYQQPAPSVELTLGLQLQLKLSDKISAYFTSGIGYHYRHEQSFNKWSDNPASNMFKKFDTRAAYNNSGEFVGLDGLPFMSAGIRYRLK